MFISKNRCCSTFRDTPWPTLCVCLIQLRTWKLGLKSNGFAEAGTLVDFRLWKVCLSFTLFLPCALKFPWWDESFLLIGHAEETDVLDWMWLLDELHQSSRHSSPAASSSNIFSFPLPSSCVINRSHTNTRGAVSRSRGLIWIINSCLL